MQLKLGSLFLGLILTVTQGTELVLAGPVTVRARGEIFLEVNRVVVDGSPADGFELTLVDDISVLTFFDGELLTPDASGRVFLEAFTDYRLRAEVALTANPGESVSESVTGFALASNIEGTDIAYFFMADVRATTNTAGDTFSAFGFSDTDTLPLSTRITSSISGTASADGRESTFGSNFTFNGGRAFSHRVTESIFDFQVRASASATSAAAVPEPNACMLLGFIGTVLSGRRWWRRRTTPGVYSSLRK